MCFDFTKYCIKIIFILLTSFFGAQSKCLTYLTLFLALLCHLTARTFHLNLKMEADPGRVVVMLAVEIRKEEEPKASPMCQVLC